MEETVDDTPLMGFFNANREYPAARELYYADFPTKFVWNTASCKWHPRKKQTVYGRLVYIPPNAGEKLTLSVAIVILALCLWGFLFPGR
jgi:hypothetical protein